MSYFPTHAHGEFSWLDGMGTVRDMVSTVADHGQPAMALTDHGVMSGSLSLYKECKKQGLIPFPGIEAYFVEDVDDPDLRENRYHMGFLALNAAGYTALVQMTSWSHNPARFHRKPLIDWSDLYELSEQAGDDIAFTTGCYFGLVVQQHVNNGLDIDRTTRLMKKLAGLFPHTFVEIQNHKTKHEDHPGLTDIRICKDLVVIADALGLPVIAGQDSHYCDKHSKPVHDMMKSISYFGDADDYQFPGNSYHLASTPWIKRMYLPWWSRVQEGHQELLDLSNMVIPELDDYKFHVPSLSKFPDERLQKLVNQRLKDKGLDSWSAYGQRVKYEMDRIKSRGLSNYFLVVEKVTTYCRQRGIVVIARGSANGSLVCYLLGITEVDPVLWDTDFDRFIDPVRQKPPDVDLDVASDQRADLIAYVMKIFPSAVQIGTYGALGVSVDAETGEERGSVYVQYHAARRGSAKRRGEDYEEVIPKEDLVLLNKLAKETVRKGPGAHAAGFLLPGDDLPIQKLIPTMLVGGKTNPHTVTQMTMDDVEDAGYLKLDLLGLTQLTTIANTQILLGNDPLDFDWIPFDDKKACAILRSGKTAGVFQYEGFSTAKGARQMKVSNTDEAIICLALYRPALMAGGQTERYLEHRANKTIYPMWSGFMSFLDKTYGVPVYQEHVMRMFKAVGMPPDDWNALLKAVKASNDKIGDAIKVFDSLEPSFKKNMRLKGATKDEATRAWSAIREFTDYGFNKAHATSYGIAAYRGAYLKAHYPHEFMTGLLQAWAGSKKEPIYIREAHRMGIKIQRPDVNTSGVVWEINKTRTTPTIAKGLLSIDGIGLTVAEAIVEARGDNQFESIEDLIDRCPARPVSGGKNYLATGEFNGVLLKLQNAGALRSLGF